MRFRLCLLLGLGFSGSLAQVPVQPALAVRVVARKVKPVTAILGAFPDEITLLEGKIRNRKEKHIQGVRFLTGKLNGERIILARTGIGKVNAAVTTALLLEHFRPREVLFTGIAGGINPLLAPGDLVIGTRLAHHDYGTLTEKGIQLRGTRNPFTLELNPVYFSSDSALVQLAQRVSNGLTFESLGTGDSARIPRVVAGVIVTGDVFVASGTITQALRREMNAEATEMEGAAVAQVCWQQRVPFLVVRSLSDDAGNNAYLDVRTFYQTAARNSAHLVAALVAELRPRKKKMGR